MSTSYRGVIEAVAIAHGLQVELVEAVVLIESSGDPYAWNPEPKYRYLWNVRTKRPFRRLTDAEVASEVPPADFPTLAGDRDQEFWAQQASWGLMQVMGAVAREHGFTGRYLTELTAPAIGLRFGCLHLAQLLRWAKGNAIQALAAYNGGQGGNTSPPFRNGAYAAKVLEARSQLLRDRPQRA